MCTKFIKHIAATPNAEIAERHDLDYQKDVGTNKHLADQMKEPDILEVEQSIKHLSSSSAAP